MKTRKLAAIALLVLSSFAASGVAPSKTELEAMYDKAFREFDGNNYEQALKDLDAIDVRQPELAESQNLRGVILMRQKDYPNAEKALQKALAADPKFWNARFNLAEIPFLEKKWGEARKRFQELLGGNASELQGEATQLIQYKVLITYVMEGKDDMVSAMLAKFELTPETPALQYANAAIALNKKNEQEAKDTIAAAEKNFSSQLNKLFAESLYEVGWLEKPAGQTRAALALTSAAEQAAQTKTLAKTRFDEAEQALQQRDLTAARKLIDEADAADPNQAATMNLRGQILLEQKEYDLAEAEFRKAAKADPNLRDAQYNLAQVPFKKKEYAKARDRFEALFSSTSGADKDRAAQLIKFKIYLTLLLEGKDSRAQKMMEQFQFTGDTPALYYAQAAWEFQHSNPAKAGDWVTSARKIYPLPLNTVFADAFYDLGWLKPSSIETTSATAVAEANPTETAPSIEPTPLPPIALAQNTPQVTEPLTLTVPPPNATAAPIVETPVAAASSPAASRPVVASVPEAKPSATLALALVTPPPVTAESPSALVAPAQVREWAQPTLGERVFDRFWLWGPILLAAVLLLFWALKPSGRPARASSERASAAAAPRRNFDHDESADNEEQLVAPGRLAGGPPQVSLQLRASEPALRRTVMPLSRSTPANGDGSGYAVPGAAIPATVQSFIPPETFTMPAAESFDEGAREPAPVAGEETIGFDPAVSEPPSALPPEEDIYEFEPAYTGDAAEASFMEDAPVEEAETADAGVEAVDALGETEEALEAETETVSAENETIYASAEAIDEEAMGVIEEPSADVSEPALEAVTGDVDEEIVYVSAETTVVPEETVDAIEEVAAPSAAEDVEEFVPSATEIPEEPALIAAAATTDVSFESVPVAEDADAFEPIGQGQPVPYLTAEPIEEISQPEPVAPREQSAAMAALGAALAGLGALRHFVSPSPAPEAVSDGPTDHQPTTPETMPLPTTTTPSPVLRTTPAAPSGLASQPMPAAPGGMHTAVQLTFSFEIASLQFTSSFKMGALQLKPTSRIVTMRLAPSQQPQPAMNLQVTFEIASVQLAGNSLGVVRLVPSQQQRPGIISSPAFNVAGLQLVAGADAAPVQITPSEQGQASVHVTAAFQIATVEFSPSFEISSIILNSTSRNVSVQLPGSGPSAVEGAPVFEITNVQLGSKGEISTMQLNPPGSAPKRA